MILSIFLTVLALAVLFIAIGLLNDKPYLLGVGYIFLFVLGLVIAGIGNPVLPPGIEYKTGENTTTNYTYTNTTLTATNQIQNQITTTFTNLTLGFFFAIISILAFVLLLMQYRPGET